MKVAIVGAGTVGSLAAWRLASSGTPPVVYERFSSPNPWGAHAGESRLIRTVPYLETAAGDLDIIRAALPAWEELQRLSGRAILTLCGGLMIDQVVAPALVRARAIALERNDVIALDAIELAELYPQFAVSPTAAAVLDRRGGLADPAAVVAAALELAMGRGAVLHTRTRVTRIASRPEGVEIACDGDVGLFDRVVVTTGAFARELLPDLPVNARRLLLGWFAPRSGTESHLSGMPSFVWTTDEGNFLYGGPSYDGRTVKIGVDAPWGEVVDAAVDGRMVTESDIEPMRAMVRQRLPWLDETGDRFEMHIDGWSTDGRGILGHLPHDSRIIVAAGWSGHGFKLSPVLASIVSGLVRGHKPEFDISHLDPSRFGSANC